MRVRAFTCGHDYEIAHAVEDETPEQRRARIVQLPSDDARTVVFTVMCDRCLELRVSNAAKNLFHAILGVKS